MKKEEFSASTTLVDVAAVPHVMKINAPLLGVEFVKDAKIAHSQFAL